ncbi:MAG: hypothetical protein H7841_03715 [Magnetospirillum sp. WYHS-4]
MRSVPLLAADGPAEFLSVILASDFAGDGEARIARCHFTDGRIIAEGCVNRDCAERRESYLAETDPLVIVSRWEIVGTSWEAKAKALVKVRYTVIGTAEGNNIHRKIVPLAAPREDEVTYKVWKRKGRWVWVDPPEVLHVGYEGVRTALQAKIDRLETGLVRTPDNELWQRNLPLYREQLAALEALRPLAVPPASP